MLTKQQLKVIDGFVDDQYYDKERLIKYLTVHSMVGNEVFDYVDRKNRNLNRKEAHPGILDDEKGYLPVNVETFVRRIPFYFYTWDGSIEKNGEDIGDIFLMALKKNHFKDLDIDSLYLDLEYMFYQKNIAPYDIFNYMTEQTGLVTEKYFFEWVEYLHICDDIGWDNAMPDNFITAYNMAREKVNRSPIIFTPDWDMHMEKPYLRDGRVLEFEGTFPCDENNNPIMKWIGLKFRNGYRVLSCTCNKAGSGYLRVEVNPDTVVYYRDIDDDGEFFWCQVYAGPLTMEFDNSVLKYYRNKLKYTQQEVADAIGANLRTYQKWEYGTTQPDGYYLLRLINWLDIPGIQDVIKFNVPEE